MVALVAAFCMERTRAHAVVDAADGVGDGAAAAAVHPPTRDDGHLHSR